MNCNPNTPSLSITCSLSISCELGQYRTKLFEWPDTRCLNRYDNRVSDSVIFHVDAILYHIESISLYNISFFSAINIFFYFLFFFDFLLSFFFYFFFFTSYFYVVFSLILYGVFLLFFLSWLWIYAILLQFLNHYSNNHTGSSQVLSFLYLISHFIHSNIYIDNLKTTR